MPYDVNAHLLTERLLLRPWRPEEAGVMRQLWEERDPRVPPHRRLDDDGRPTVEDLAERIRSSRTDGFGILAVEERTSGALVGWCGLVDNGRGAPGEPEIAFELLVAARGRGYATEAGRAVVDEARRRGITRLWATVWDWNAPSRRVLARLGFVETGRTAADPERGVTVWTSLDLSPTA